MPMTGLSAFEWKKRLQQYAQGTFIFGRGPMKEHTGGRSWQKLNNVPNMGILVAVTPLGRGLPACVATMDYPRSQPQHQYESVSKHNTCMHERKCGRSLGVHGEETR